MLRVGTKFMFRSKRYKEIKAVFEEGGIHIETRWEAVIRWFREKWDRFGSI